MTENAAHSGTGPNDDRSPDDRSGATRDHAGSTKSREDRESLNEPADDTGDTGEEDERSRQLSNSYIAVHKAMGLGWTDRATTAAR